MTGLDNQLLWREELSSAICLTRSGLSCAPELYIYYPVDSRVKALQPNSFERQVVFLLSTSPVSRDYVYESECMDCQPVGL